MPMESSFVAIFLGGAVTAALAMVLIALSRAAHDRYRIRRGAIRISCHEPRMGLTQTRRGCHRLAYIGLEHLGDQLTDLRVEQAAGQIGDAPGRSIRLVVAHHDVSAMRMPPRPARPARSPSVRRIG